jgi:hypothetical protein
MLNSLKTTLRTGDFLTPRLLYIISIFIALSLCFALVDKFFLHNSSVNNSLEKTLYDTDFIAFYAAGKLAKAGTPEKIYDWKYNAETQNNLTHLRKEYPVPFPYPPFFIKVMEVFNSLSYQKAWIAFQGITILAAIFVIYRVYPSSNTVLAFFAFSPIFVNIGIGQTAFLTTALFGAFLINLEKRPWLAGVFRNTPAPLYKGYFLE